MREVFESELRRLSQELLNMGAMVEQAIEKAVRLLKKHSEEESKKIMEDDARIDDQQKKIEFLCINLLVEQQPVARDLRLVVAAMNMAGDLERIGDQAANIAEIALMLSPADTLSAQRTSDEILPIDRMAAQTLSMVIRSIQAFVDRDAEMAKSVIDNDDLVDQLFVDVKKDVIWNIQENADVGERAVDILMAAKYFERIGDHATNIAQSVLFAIGEIKPYTKEKKTKEHFLIES